MSEQFSEAFCEIITLAERMEVQNIKELPGCWEVDLADGWSMAVNGHVGEVTSSHGVSVPGHHAVALHKGLVIGLIHPTQGGTMLGRGSEDAFIEALKATAVTP